MQLRLGEGALHAEHEAVVELGGAVTAVLVDHERAGDGAQFCKRPTSGDRITRFVVSRQPDDISDRDSSFAFA
jgi:hypothetical protein